MVTNHTETRNLYSRTERRLMSNVHAGKHAVVEMTRQKKCMATAASASSLAILLDASTVGAVAINETIVLKVALEAGV